MKRKFLSTLLALCMLTAFVPVAARAYYGTQYGDWLYYEVNENGDGVIITDCDSNASGEIVIPDEIDNLPVTSIGDFAFSDCEKLTKIMLPQNLTYIGNRAFESCSAWEGELAIPDSVTSIGDYTFYDCEKLTKITLPQNLMYIGEHAFSGCSAWDGELTIPSGVTSIDDYTFNNCEKLTK